MLVSFLDDDPDSPLSKIITFIRAGAFVIDSFGVLLVIIGALLIILVPALLILGSSENHSEDAFNYMEYYTYCIEEEIPSFFKEAEDEINRIISPDVLEFIDHTYITEEILLAIDSARYYQDYEKINKKDINKVINLMLRTDYEKITINDKRNVKVAITDSNGDLKYDSANDDFLVNVLESKHPKGKRTTSGGREYYVYTKNIKLTKVVATVTSISFSEIMDILDFDDEQKTLGYTYYSVVMDSVTEFAGEAGNYVFTEDKTEFLTPIEVEYPLEKSTYTRITSLYGYREYMYEGVLQKGYHHGIDFGLPVGTPMIASKKGTVTRVQYSPDSYGHWIEIDHGKGFKTRYAHLNSTQVVVGDVVEQGQRIALSGNSGKSTGAHLHFEIRINDNTVDPLPFLNLKREESL